MRFLIVPGHGGLDKGTASPDGRLCESTYVLDIGLRLFDMVDALSPRDIQFAISRTDDDTKHTLSVRAGVADKWQADFVMCLHVDYSTDEERSGLAAYYYPGNTRTEYVCDSITRSAPGELYRRMGRARPASRGIWPRVHNVLARYKCPAVLIELGMASNKYDVDSLLSENTKESLVASLYGGILAARAVL
jgi:N-acetylmuramoyl-L-alanine amidase